MPYRTRKKAMNMVAKVAKERGEKLRIYLCETCGSYHIGHDIRKEVRMRRATSKSQLKEL
jgi:hypothetical protein